MFHMGSRLPPTIVSPSHSLLVRYLLRWLHTLSRSILHQHHPIIMTLFHGDTKPLVQIRLHPIRDVIATHQRRAIHRQRSHHNSNTSLDMAPIRLPSAIDNPLIVHPSSANNRAYEHEDRQHQEDTDTESYSASHRRFAKDEYRDDDDGEVCEAVECGCHCEHGEHAVSAIAEETLHCARLEKPGMTCMYRGAPAAVPSSLQRMRFDPNATTNQDAAESATALL